MDNKNDRGEGMNTFKYQDLKKKNYFEGWYQRITDENNNVNYAFIFGITKNESDPHAFIQVFDGIKNEMDYYRFEYSDFYYSKDTVFIKENYLSLDSMYLKTDALEISVLFTNTKKLNNHYKNNSAMSFLSKLPLECFQEIVVMDALYKGELTVGNQLTHISGKSYLEKTYGNKFPTKWIWIQGNHFNKDVSLSFSHAIVPIFKWKKKGFLTILNHNDKEYRFASYNLARMKILERSYSQVEIVIRKRRYKLVIIAKLVKPTKLVGPSENGVMNLKVYESINSLATLTFTKGRKIIFDTMGRSIGFENMYD